MHDHEESHQTSLQRPCAYRLVNPAMRYAWGRTEGIEPYIAIETEGNIPVGEVWMGAHPKAPSSVVLEQQTEPLDALIAREPAYWLGEQTALQWRELPFLFKVLAAGAPLSLQVHPGLEAAQRGFARENAATIPLLDPRRTFKDPHHKPELAVALTPFRALAGFRSPEEISALFGAPLAERLELHAGMSRDDLPALVRTLLNWPRASFSRIEALLLARAEELISSSNEAYAGAGRLALELHHHYPGDPGQFAAFFLEQLFLQPGEGLFVPAGVMHAYLEGSILEIMACSDNVVRGGLTAKFVDVDLLCAVLDPAASPIRVVPQREEQDGCIIWKWNTPAREFQLEARELLSEGTHRIVLEGPSVLLCTEGAVSLQCPSLPSSMPLPARASVFVPGAAPWIELNGRGRVWIAHPAPAPAPASPTITLWIDADSLPRDLRPLLVRRATSRKPVHGTELAVRFVGTRPHADLPADAMIVVPQGEGSTDRYIIMHAQQGDLCMTRDLPLAEQLVSQGLLVLNDRGDVFDETTVAERRSIRDAMAELRALGIASPSPRGNMRTPADTKRFADALDRLLLKAARGKQQATMAARKSSRPSGS
ncbi:MAG: mannose-6-phosphate isomerase, class I [Spirochaetaceae bacterium]|nr:mannose-6-phosphate isomerase, class I [Spirochaetaceae bacterium]